MPFAYGMGRIYDARLRRRGRAGTCRIDDGRCFRRPACVVAYSFRVLDRRCFIFGECGPQLQAAMQAVQKEGRGVIVYLRQEGRGIGLINKIRAYRLQDQGLDTVEANVALGLPVDARDFTLAKQIYDYLHIREVRLLTNNPEKIQTLKDSGINVVGRIALHVGENV